MTVRHNTAKSGLINYEIIHLIILEIFKGIYLIPLFILIVFDRIRKAHFDAAWLAQSDRELANIMIPFCDKY